MVGIGCAARAASLAGSARAGPIVGVVHRRAAYYAEHLEGPTPLTELNPPETVASSPTESAFSFRRTRANWSAYARASGLSTVFLNAGSLVGTTVITGGLGAVYWWVAARFFAAADVGSAGAAIAATMLLGVISLLGTGTLLIGEMGRGSATERRRLVVTALSVSALAGGLLGLAFAVAAPYVASDLRLFGGGPGAVALFTVTVSLTAVGIVIDHVLIGLLRGDVQLGRNVLMAVGKLAVLVGFTRLHFADGALAIYLSLVGGTLLSFASVVHMGGFGRLPLGAYRPQWTLLRRLGRTALEHHTLNLSLQVPSLMMPLLVTVLLSATVNAYFYVASMFASLVFLIPTALSTVLYAAGSREPATLAHKMRLTLGLSTAAGLLANLVLLVAAEPLLALFGRAYAQEVVSVLRVLVAAVFPGIIKTHFVAVCQLHRQVRRGAMLTVSGAVLELIVASMGARLAGLNGFVLGYVAALCLEALIMAPVVIGALGLGRASLATVAWRVVPLSSEAGPD